MLPNEWNEWDDKKKDIYIMLCTDIIINDLQSTLDDFDGEENVIYNRMMSKANTVKLPLPIKFRNTINGRIREQLDMCDELIKSLTKDNEQLYNLWDDYRVGLKYRDIIGDGVLWISPDDLIEFDISPYMHDGRDVNYITRNDKDKIECWAAKPLADVDDIAHKHVIIANNFIGNKKLYSSVKDFIGDVIKIHGTDYKNIVNDKIEELYVDKCDIYVYVSDKVAYCIHKSMLKYINTHNEKNAINCDKYNESLIGLNEVKRLRW